MAWTEEDNWTEWETDLWRPNIQWRHLRVHGHISTQMRQIDPNLKVWQFLYEHDWCQGHMRVDQNGEPIVNRAVPACGFCAAGAIEAVYGPAFGDKRLEVNPKLEALRIRINDGIGSWNDQPGMTKDDVIATLKEMDI